MTEHTDTGADPLDSTDTQDAGGYALEREQEIPEAVSEVLRGDV